MKNILILLLSLAAAGTAFAQKIPAGGKEIMPGLADPHVLKYKDQYYLYGTSDKASQGFKVYVSKDLVTWSSALGAANGLALRKGDAWGESMFWAPEVVHYQEKFYMLYCADSHIALAVSDSPLGPFVKTSDQPLHPDIKEIDPALLFDNDGRIYYYFVRFDQGNKIYAAEMNKDLKSLKESSLLKVIDATEGWEHTANNPNMAWPVTEAPYVMKHNGMYYLFYTANHFRNPAYAVGYAVSKSPLGPFIKADNNPVIKAAAGAKGTGTLSVVQGPDKQWYVFYHAHNSDTKVAPRRTMMAKLKFVKQSGKPDKVEIDLN